MARREFGRSGLFAIVGLAVLLATACSNVIVGTPHGPQSVPIRFQGTPADATVTIDDQRVGSLALVTTRGIRVMPGRHRITVEAPGFLPFDRAIEAKDEVVPVPVALVPIPD